MFTNEGYYFIYLKVHTKKVTGINMYKNYIMRHTVSCKYINIPGLLGTL